MNNIDWKSLINYKTFDELRQAAFQRWQSSGSKITNLNIGGVWRTLLELACQGLAALYDLLLSIVPKGFLKDASGDWLILKANERGLEQNLDQKAEGLVVFGRYDASGNAKIQAGSIVKTDVTPSGEELRYFTKADYVCPDGIAELAIPVIAEFTGAKYNVGQGAIKNMVTHVPGFDYVTNTSAWLTKEGADIETDESLKERCRLVWYELAVGDPAGKYKSWAKKVPGVIDVFVNDQHPRGPGTVDVVILSSSGMPTADLISQVQSYINARKQNCADVLVRAPLAELIDISLAVYLMPDSNLDLSYVETLASQYTNAYFGQGVVSGVSRLKISQDYIRLDLASKTKATNPQDIKNVVTILPADDVTIDDGKIAVLNNLTITVERATEE